MGLLYLRGIDLQTCILTPIQQDSSGNFLYGSPVDIRPQLASIQFETWSTNEQIMPVWANGENDEPLTFGGSCTVTCIMTEGGGGNINPLAAMRANYTMAQIYCEYGASSVRMDATLGRLTHGVMSPGHNTESLTMTRKSTDLAPNPMFT